MRLETVCLLKLIFKRVWDYFIEETSS
jgi:hypothetical protein